MILPWHSGQTINPYMVYDGNRFELKPSPRRLHIRGHTCTHYEDSVIPGDLFLPRKN
jgi:hypothetical protein